MERDSGEHEISFCGLLCERLRGLGSGTQLLRQRGGYVGQRISGTAGDDEFAFLKQRLRFAPLAMSLKASIPISKKERSLF